MSRLDQRLQRGGVRRFFSRKRPHKPDPAPAQHAPSQLDHFLTRRPSSPDRCVTAILKPRRPPSPTPSGPTPLCPTPPPAATRPLLSRGTHPARGPRPHLRATIRPPPSVGLLTPPPPPPGRCRQHRLMRATPLRRVVTVGPCHACTVCCTCRVCTASARARNRAGRNVLKYVYA